MVAMVRCLGNLLLSEVGWEVPSGDPRAEHNSRAAAGGRIQALNQPTEGRERESSSPWPRSAVADSMA